MVHIIHWWLYEKENGIGFDNTDAYVNGFDNIFKTGKTGSR